MRNRRGGYESSRPIAELGPPPTRCKPTCATFGSHAHDCPNHPQRSRPRPHCQTCVCHQAATSSKESEAATRGHSDAENAADGDSGPLRGTPAESYGDEISPEETK